MRRVTLLLAVGLLLAACNEEFDPAERRAALRDEYDVRDQECLVEGDRAVARGVVINYSEATEEFGVTVRFLDGSVDLGRPQNVNGDVLVEHLGRWPYEASVAIDEPPDDLRCNVLRVAIGSDVGLDGP